MSSVESQHVAPHKDTVDATFDDLDLHNTLASKADDSDGKTRGPSGRCWPQFRWPGFTLEVQFPRS
jgi:hypothetical protein